MSWIQHIDEQIFLFLNGLHHPWLDPVMIFITGNWQWLPLYLFIIGYFIYRYRKQSILMILLIILVFAATDFISASIIKPLVNRPRPCSNEDLLESIHNIVRCGKYSFISSHAANTFGLATIVTLLSKPEIKWTKWLFLWATIVSYSRIYVGVHYLTDILCGASFGIVAAYVLYVTYRYILMRIQQQTK